MIAYLIRRLGSTLFAIWAISTLVLLLSEQYTAEDLARVRHRLGLDRPLPVQYGRFLVGVVTLDFGASYRFDQPARELVVERFPATLILAVSALGLALLASVPLGVISAVRRNSPLDVGVSFLSF